MSGISHHIEFVIEPKKIKKVLDRLAYSNYNMPWLEKANLCDMSAALQYVRVYSLGFYFFDRIVSLN